MIIATIKRNLITEDDVLVNDPLTIRDYLARLEPLKDRTRRLMNHSLRPDEAGDPFTRLLTSSLTRRKKSDTAEEGLTAVDYLANPIPVARFHRWAARGDSPLSGRPDAKISEAQGSSDRHPPSQGLQTEDIPPAAAHHRRAQNQSPVHDDAGSIRTIDRCIRDAAQKYDVSPDLISAVIEAESNFAVDAVSVVGAQGLMQLMPATARELGVDDPFDIRQNIDGGTRYLRQMLDLFGGDIRKALSAYNAGPGNVIRYNGNVPFAETKRYVSRILDSLGHTV